MRKTSIAIKFLFLLQCQGELLFHLVEENLTNVSVFYFAKSLI